MLKMIKYGQKGATPPLLIVHGLYGSARNWGVIAKRLSDEHQTITVDQRNHGDSPWFETHSYIDMANDLITVAQHIGRPLNVVGHSMGGKAAMVMALMRPDLVNRIIVADIAPIAYGHDQSQYIQAMQAVDLRRVHKRSDAMKQLAQIVEDTTLQSFFTQSLDVAGKRWKLNLDVLGRDMHHILGFPEIQGSFDGPALFLSGSESPYVQDDGKTRAKAFFPNAQFAKLKGAGHWLHAEKPREFEAAVRHYFAADL
ncbi:MAG: alpha/beta fold hydrolase [Candidatus Puniceispirillum sp.]|jgi:pimeloyl-ACP methyl ester carboxylesterase